MITAKGLLGSFGKSEGFFMNVLNLPLPSRKCQGNFRVIKTPRISFEIS